jgi:hypothetical protein
MPFHVCQDELFALMMLVPFITPFVIRLKVWYHRRAKHHKCHEGTPVVTEKPIEEEAR